MTVYANSGFSVFWWNPQGVLSDSEQLHNQAALGPCFNMMVVFQSTVKQDMPLRIA